VVEGGASRRVGPNGLLIGRQQDCDLVALDPRVSRRHALVRLTADAAEVVPLGRTPIEINSKLHDKPHALCDGDTITLPGLVLAVELRAQAPDPKRDARFTLERAAGGTFGIVHSPFVIGGGDTADLIVKRWPAQALRLHVAQHELFVEVVAGKATKNGAEITADALEPLGFGDRLGYRRETFVVGAADACHARTTAVADLGDLPARVAIEMLPRGGRVVFVIGGGERAVYLADRQLDLVIALLRPPAPYVVGEYVPDEVVRGIVWPRDPSVSRPEINMLISRCRRSLVEAGLAGPRLLERAPGGGGTRLALAPGAEVVIHG
jgi:hypothetical protein